MTHPLRNIAPTLRNITHPLRNLTHTPRNITHTPRNLVIGAPVMPIGSLWPVRKRKLLMPNPTYPPNTVRALIQSDAVTPPTRDALLSRLDAPPHSPQFFDEAEMATLRAACARLIPQTDRAVPLEIASPTDERLAKGKGDGWRYDTMPPDGTAYRIGLRGLNQSADLSHGAPFVALNGEDQDAILRDVQTGKARGEIWKTLPSARFFEEMLGEATENYYCHPLAQEEIGYAGFADAPGWVEIGLNQREAREAEANHV